jgi:hypothetical protein
MRPETAAMSVSNKPHPIAAIFGCLLLLWSGVYIMQYSVIFWKEYVASKPSAGSVLTQGTVIERNVVQLSRSVRRPVLTVQVSNDHATVRAILGVDGSEDIPDQVHFYYSGNSQDEVFLLEESNPLWLALVCLLGACMSFFPPVAFIARKIQVRITAR